MTPALPLIPEYLLRMPSPIGRIELGSDGTSVTSLTIERDGSLPFDSQPERSTDVLERASAQLAEYFSGARRSFDVPIVLRGTPFQLAVWEHLKAIPWSGYTTYGSLGAEIGRPGSGRAIGGAVGANPVPILVPCHRVLASDRRITGYSGGNGIPTKVWLLSHEGIGFAA
ncbi:methylated-DNA--[protein]-cysteine S-methyltransferase [Planctomonas psychrotolerans]|uniref:methylated-DNA--[protein]-cysteine S-methyltransferase n=1 Tax=Planctomonas psychrotolerans TaxID=2528712 RepID=UPI001D0D68F0|nr:methylated-DNA--[protein]-cysteine S-methyltransferase [Planctomonas psychrotolerans]